MDHRREWFCPLCNLVYHDKLKARMHIIQHYGNPDDQNQVDLLLQTSSRLPEHLSAGDCPFCDWSTILRKRNITSKEHDLTVPSRRFMKHLGRHLEEIALFVVPQPEEYQVDSDDIGSNAVHAAQGEDSATNSTLSSFNSKRLSVSSEYNQGLTSDDADRGPCPHFNCGKYIHEGLKSHMLEHQDERPEKCPLSTCEYHTKGFARRYDRNRHTLTHYKGNIVCGFCPGTLAKSFTRADVFKRHLTSVHGVEQTPPNARRKSLVGGKRLSYSKVRDVAGMCSTCGIMFVNAQELYEHLDDCVLRVVQQAEPSEAINERLLMAVADDPAVHAFTAYSDDVRLHSSAPSSQSNQRFQQMLKESLGDSETALQENLKQGELDREHSRKLAHEARAGLFPSNVYDDDDDDGHRLSGSTEHLDQPQTTPLSDLQAEQSPAQDGRPSHSDRLPAPYHGLVNERIQTANTLRSSSPYLHVTSAKRSPFKSGSPLAPNQNPFTGIDFTPLWGSQIQSPSRQESNFDITAITDQQASALKSQESGDEVVSASVRYNTPFNNQGDLPNEAPGNIDPAMPASSSYERDSRSSPGSNRLPPDHAQMVAQQREAQMNALQQRLAMRNEETRLEREHDYASTLPGAGSQIGDPYTDLFDLGSDDYNRSVGNFQDMTVEELDRILDAAPSQPRIELPYESLNPSSQNAPPNSYLSPAIPGQAKFAGQPHLNMVAEAESPQRRSGFATDLPRAMSSKHAFINFDAAAFPADTAPPLQQSQPLVMPQWPSMLSSQAQKTHNTYYPQPIQPLSFPLANESASTPDEGPDYPLQPQLLKEQNHNRLVMERPRHEPRLGWTTKTAVNPEEISLLRGQANTNAHTMSDSQTRDLSVHNHLKSLIPQQAHDQTSFFPQTQDPPCDRTPTAGTPHQLSLEAEIEYQQKVHEEMKAAMQQNDDPMEKIRRANDGRTWSTTPAPTLPPSQNVPDAQPQHASLSKTGKLPSVHQITTSLHELAQAAVQEAHDHPHQHASLPKTEKLPSIQQIAPSLYELAQAAQQEAHDHPYQHGPLRRDRSQRYDQVDPGLPILFNTTLQSSDSHEPRDNGHQTIYYSSQPTNSASRPMLPPPPGLHGVPLPPPPMMIPGPYKCDVPNCTAGTFQTQYLLK